MIKILKKRNKINCTLCDSRFSFEKEDIEEEIRIIKMLKDVNCKEYNYTIKCPVCGKINLLSTFII